MPAWLKWLFSTSSHAPKHEGQINLLKPRTKPGIVQTQSSLAVPDSQIPAYTPTVQPAQAAPAPTGAVGQYQPLVGTQVTKPAAAASEAQPVQKQTPTASGMVFDNSIAKSIRRKPTSEDSNETPILQATAQDHEDWLRERARCSPTDRKPGVTVRQEYENWLRARFRARSGQSVHGLRAAAR